MESIFLYNTITIIPSSVLHVSLSYYIINPCTSASSNFDDSFSYVVLRARVIPECLDNPNINSLREVTSCQNGLSD
ncbi:XXYS1_4_G0025730.mRNA.1.CDS.1 [Saccharomyces cerevisiae]|nr:XXYS1_4_G0025730.mRNA.1.CDS.1 [Saccharomyces cerevisiae]